MLRPFRKAHSPGVRTLLTAGDRSRIFAGAQETRMAIAFNQTTVAAEPINRGVTRQRLIADERVKGIKVLFDRLAHGARPTATSTIARPPLTKRSAAHLGLPFPMPADENHVFA